MGLIGTARQCSLLYLLGLDAHENFSHTPGIIAGIVRITGAGLDISLSIYIYGFSMSSSKLGNCGPKKVIQEDKHQGPKFLLSFHLHYVSNAPVVKANCV